VRVQDRRSELLVAEAQSIRAPQHIVAEKLERNWCRGAVVPEELFDERVATARSAPRQNATAF